MEDNNVCYIHKNRVAYKRTYRKNGLAHIYTQGAAFSKNSKIMVRAFYNEQIPLKPEV